MLAVIEIKNQQYIATPGAKIQIDRLQKNIGEVFTCDKVLLISDDKKVLVGTPYLAKYSIDAVIISQQKKKITVGKFKRKTRYNLKKGSHKYKTTIEFKEIKTP